MTTSTQYNIVRYPTAPIPGSTQEERTESQEQKVPQPLSNSETYSLENNTSQTSSDEVASSTFESNTYKTTIYGSGSASAPIAGLSLLEREQLVDAYANRVKAQIGNIESGSEGERNVKFQNVRLFMEPSGYFSAGLLAAGYDPNEKITVTFNSYVGKWKPEHLTDTDTRTYFAWEIAAGALKHDKPPGGGLLNFHQMEIAPKDQSKINDLESLGKKLQNYWEDEIAKPMRDESGEITKRSGKADNYLTRGTLQSLANNKESFKKLSTEGQEAVNRTLENNGQVIIPNIYGFPLAGYAFIPYTPYDGNYDHRPNKGLMIDLKNGAVHEIRGDEDFSNWTKSNRNDLLRSFNASDRQGGKDAHWPKAGDVLDNLIAGNHASYPGYSSLLKDKAVPVWETFNYTESRGSEYRLKYGNLDSSIAAKYQEVNAKNAVWSDQTEVFGSSQQIWKDAKELWGRTFGYVPILGNAGNIYFGVHDSTYGMTADDRIGGSAAAVISGLQLLHELAPYAAESGSGDVPANVNALKAKDYSWEYNSKTNDFELVRVQKEPTSLAPVAPITETVSKDGNLVTLTGTKDNLNKVEDNLYTFADMNKKGTQHRLNIIAHGDGTHIFYNGKKHTPQGLYNTLKRNGVIVSHYDNIRILSCYSGKLGENSFAAEFQRLTDRPVKGYTGEIIARYSAEEITGDSNVIYKSGENPVDNPDAINNNSIENKEFKPEKNNPYSIFQNPFKWWKFSYKPVVFAPGTNSL
ncbi:hypothetical protein [Pseudomonas capeferrum]